MKLNSKISWLILLCFIIRIVFSTFFHSPEEHLYSDMKSYHKYSEMILSGEYNEFFFFQPIGFKFVLAGLKVIFYSRLPSRMVSIKKRRYTQFLIGVNAENFEWLAHNSDAFDKKDN